MKFIKHKGGIQDAPIACLDPVSSIGVDIDTFDLLQILASLNVFEYFSPDIFVFLVLSATEVVSVDQAVPFAVGCFRFNAFENVDDLIDGTIVFITTFISDKVPSLVLELKMVMILVCIDI